MASNENPLGSSPLAREAFLSTQNGLALYPDGSSALLRQAIGAHHDIPAEQIVCGAGSDELLSLLASAYLDDGNEAIYTRHGFLVYPNVIKAAGATPVVAPEQADRASVSAILACLTDKTRMVFLANPNNPTGTLLTRDEIASLHKGLPPHVLLVLDAAYAEYVSDESYEPGIELVRKYNNVVMTRTFSKIYGLASLRVGWLYGSRELVDVINTVRGPFNLSSGAQAAAVAALGDQSFVEASRLHNERWRSWLTQELTKRGLRVTPGTGNFLLVHVGGEGGKRAQAIDEALKDEGVLVRAMGAYHYPDALRVTIGTEEGNRALIRVLDHFLANNPSG